MLKNAKVIDDDDINTDVVSVGAKVKVLDLEFDEETEYQIVGSTETVSYTHLALRQLLYAGGTGGLCLSEPGHAGLFLRGQPVYDFKRPRQLFPPEGQRRQHGQPCGDVYALSLIHIWAVQIGSPAEKRENGTAESCAVFFCRPAAQKRK